MRDFEGAESVIARWSEKKRRKEGREARGAGAARGEDGCEDETRSRSPR